MKRIRDILIYIASACVIVWLAFNYSSRLLDKVPTVWQRRFVIGFMAVWVVWLLAEVARFIRKKYWNNVLAVLLLPLLLMYAWATRRYHLPHQEDPRVWSWISVMIFIRHVPLTRISVGCMWMATICLITANFLTERSSFYWVLFATSVAAAFAAFWCNRKKDEEKPLVHVEGL